MAFDFEGTLARVQRSRGFYKQFVEKVPDDKLDWKPQALAGGDATSVLEITRHIIASEYFFLKMLGPVPEGHSPIPDEPFREDWASSDAFATSGPAAGVTDKAELLAKVDEAAEVFDSHAKRMSPEVWDEEFDAGWMKGPRRMFLGLIATHYEYHCGQVAYLARLWGDLEF